MSITPRPYVMAAAHAARDESRTRLPGRLARATGAALSIAAVGWVLHELASGIALAKPVDLGVRDVAALVALSLAYAAASLPLSSAWALLCSSRWPPEPGEFSRSALVFGRTQLYKYLPGNVFHLAGRHVVLERAGHRRGDLFRAALAEQISLVSAAAIVSLILLSAADPASLPITPPRDSANRLGFATIVDNASILALLAIAATLGMLQLLCGKLSGGSAPARSILQAGVSTLSLHSLFFVCAGCVLVGAFQTIFPTGADVGPALLVPAFCVSWMLGYVTPGSPAGVGVRDATLTALLIALTGHRAEAVTLAATLRLLTVAGDLIVWTVSTILSRRSSSNGLGRVRS